LEVAVTRLDQPSSRDGDEAEAPTGRFGPFSIAECRDSAPHLRRELETLDYELRGVVNRVLAEVEDAEGDAATFLRAAATVLLSVAAGTMETAAERAREPSDVGAFKDVAEDVAQWARSRKLRELLTDEE
jgi:hypothetical protein